MAFHPRKLLNDSFQDAVDKFCKTFCDPLKNPAGVCPIDCIARCCQIPPPAPDLDLVVISDNSNHHRKPLGLSLFLSVSLALLATVFFVFCCYSVYRFYRWRFNNSRSGLLSSQAQPPSRQPPEEEAHLEFLDEHRGPLLDHPIWYIRTVGLQPSVISAITVCKYKRGDGLVEGTECSVCLNEFQEDETLRLLPKCNHAFHIPCIDTWLASHTNCPNCRAGIVQSTPNFRPAAPSLENSGRLEEEGSSQASVSENRVNLESERERESGVVEVRIDMEGEMESRAIANSSEDDVGTRSSSREGGGEGIQPLRRSVSLDSVSVSAIKEGIANAFSVESDSKKDEISVKSGPKGAGDDQSCSSSMERSQHKETSSVKRSVSCSAKVFLSRYNRSRNASLSSMRL